MKHVRSMGLAVAVALGACAGFACGSTTNGAQSNTDGGANAAASACAPCVTDDDCKGGAVCAQLGADTYCARTCPQGNECSADEACTGATTVTGAAVSVCAPTNGGCANGAPSATNGKCGALVPPNEKSSCTSCGAGAKNCQPNGCFGGWCDESNKKCQAPPPGCGTATGPLDAGAPVTGSIDGHGGTLSRLLFAVVGDTRPAFIGDTKGYPTKIIDPIFTRIEALQPHPPFAIATGDYMFAVPFTNQASAQLDLYLASRNKYSGTLFPALGNHECTGSTTSNCGQGNADGMPANFTAFLQKMLAPIQKTDPYYSINVNASDGSWTSKFVFVAANAWSDAQASWLESTLAQPTTYTFVVRHESREANTAPGVKPSEQIMAAHPYTIAIVGHTHTYEHFASSREVIVGNGGAPLTGSKNYGFAVFNQRPDGTIQVDMIDYQTGAADTGFRFAVQADGSPAN